MHLATNKILQIGARKSDLARLQAYLVGTALKEKTFQDVQYTFRESLGDKNLNDPLWKMPEKGVFTQDFYQDLISGKLDCVVHSWKDLPVDSSPETEIIATLPRADQRDLILFKKTSLHKKNIQIYSSSPRREHNLKPFLKSYLPWQIDTVDFCSVRGNVQTRVRKLIEDPTTDGLILAKAALDRLLSHDSDEFVTTKNQLLEHLNLCQWMVLPLSENPNAAAQGALAIEIRKDRSDLKKLFAHINCSQTAEAVQKERKIFSAYGGGCHQKIGIAVLQRPYGEIIFSKGLTPSGEELNTVQLIRSQNSPPTSLIKKELNFKTSRTALNFDLPPKTQAVWVARTDGQFLETLNSFRGYIWAAGLQTWKKLSDLGLWVHGCAEGLGEKENPQIETLTQTQNIEWTYLSHSMGHQVTANNTIATYDLDIEVIETTFDPELMSQQKYFFYWKSESQFNAALKKYPDILHQYHACGPGKTWQILSKQISTEKLFIYLNSTDWLKESLNDRTT